MLDFFLYWQLAAKYADVSVNEAYRNQCKFFPLDMFLRL